MPFSFASDSNHSPSFFIFSNLCTFSFRFWMFPCSYYFSTITHVHCWLGVITVHVVFVIPKTPLTFLKFYSRRSCTCKCNKGVAKSTYFGCGVSVIHVQICCIVWSKCPNVHIFCVCVFWFQLSLIGISITAVHFRTTYQKLCNVWTTKCRHVRTVRLIQSFDHPETCRMHCLNGNLVLLYFLKLLTSLLYHTMLNKTHRYHATWSGSIYPSLFCHPISSNSFACFQGFAA